MSVALPPAAVVLIVVALRYRPTIEAHLDLRRRVARLVEWRPAAGTVLLTNDAAEADRLTRSPGQYRRTSVTSADLNVTPLDGLADAVPRRPGDVRFVCTVQCDGTTRVLVVYQTMGSSSPESPRECTA